MSSLKERCISPISTYPTLGDIPSKFRELNVIAILNGNKSFSLANKQPHELYGIRPWFYIYIVENNELRINYTKFIPEDSMVYEYDGKDWIMCTCRYLLK